MSTNIFHVIYFCQHTFEVYFKLPAKDKKIFFFVYKFHSIYYQSENFMLTVALTVTKLLLKILLINQNVLLNILSKKKTCNPSDMIISVENVLLNGKIVIGHCTGHNTIILLISIDGFKERTVRLCFDVE